MNTRVIPQHCNDCTWFFSKMGACPHPDASIFFSYMSLLPYFIIFYLIALTLFKRKISLIRLTSMLVCAYIIGDKILKNIFQSKIKFNLRSKTTIFMQKYFWNAKLSYDSYDCCNLLYFAFKKIQYIHENWNDMPEYYTRNRKS